MVLDIALSLLGSTIHRAGGRGQQWFLPITESLATQHQIWLVVLVPLAYVAATATRSPRAGKWCCSRMGRRRAGYRRSKSATKTLLGSGSTGAGPKCRSGLLPVVNSMRTRSRHHHHLQRPALHTISTHLGGRLCPPLPPRHQPGLCHLPLMVAAQPHIAASSISRRRIANGYALQA